MTKYVGWANSLNRGTGESFLAKKFLKFSKLNKNIKIYGPTKTNYLGNYLSTIYGIFALWYWFLKGKKTVYINYLPLWNIFIFLLCPPGTLFGPITGSIQVNRINNIKSFLRKFIFPILYFISNIILLIRSNKIIFASNILKKHIFHVVMKKSLFNFVLKDIKIGNSKFKKKYDYIIYYNNHENKFFPHHINFLERLIKKKKKIIIFGDQMKLNGVKHMGKVSKLKLINHIKYSRYTVSGDDNLLSLFNLECLEKNLKIIYNHKLDFQVPKNMKKNFIAYNYLSKKFI